jgi:uncharacterized protein YbbK (DUF523 family)
LLNNSDATVVPIARGGASGLSCPRNRHRLRHGLRAISRMREKDQAMDDHNSHDVTVPYEARMVLTVAVLQLQAKALERQIKDLEMRIETLEAGAHP